MNLLQMAQFVQGNIGTSQDLPFVGPTTVVGATGQYLEFVNYIQQAYKLVQLDQDNWKWRTARAQLTLLPGQYYYTLTQIQAQIPDWEEILHFHFIDDTRYGLVAQNQSAPSTTTTSGAVTMSDATYYVPITAISSYDAFQIVTVSDGTNIIRGPVQSINASILCFAVEQVTVTGTATSMSVGAAVAYSGPFKPPDIANQTFCFFIEYQNWRGWKDRNILPKSKPTFYTRTPAAELEFNPVPDVNYSPYVFFTDYRTTLDVLNTASDTSTPLYLPPRYHEIICWRAIMYWAISRGKGDKYQAASNEYERILARMYIEQLPNVEPYLMEMYG